MRSMNNQNSKVQILMSTYNGEKYLRVQMDSILNQSWKNLELLVRDDGSSDGTLQILHEYEEKYPNVKVYAEENVGYRKSFFKLLSMSDAPYVMFADQDDYWLPEKIEAAVVAMEKENAGDMPLMYFCQKLLVDQDLKPMSGQKLVNYKPGFNSAVIENMCSGCTVMMNRPLVEKICIHLPEHDIYHDWWCYLVACYYGKTIFDPKPYMYYRQHGNNQVGAEMDIVGQIHSKKMQLEMRKGKLKAQLSEFREYHHGYDASKDKLVEKILSTETNLRNRLALAFGGEMKRQNVLDQIAVRVLTLAGKIL